MNKKTIITHTARPRRNGGAGKDIQDHQEPRGNGLRECGER